jgi:ribonuclease Z
MYVTILGSCANQTANREGVALLFENENSALLVDAGPGIIASLQRANKKASDINNLLLTHTHGDHILGFAYFVWNRNFERLGQEPAKNLNVYGNATTIDAAKTMFEKSYPEAKFPFKVNYFELISNDKFNADEFSVNVVDAIHPIPTLSCVIRDKNNKLVCYSSDSLPNEQLLQLCQNADLLIHEGMFTSESEALSRKVMHSTAKDAGKFATESKCAQLIMVHIAPSLFGRETVLLKEAREEFKGNISIPCDGSIYCI